MQFAHELFDRHAEEVYHYVLAWTGDQASAVDLTTMVLRTAVARMDQLAEGADAAELEMRLIALVRAAVTRWRARRPGEQRAATAVPEESMPLFEALGELDDNRREVLTLVELLGQEPERAGRLLGCDAKSVEAQRDESLESLWRAMNQAPPDHSVSTWDRLTVDTALRRAAAEWTSQAEAVLGYVGEQLFGEAPVGVPATAPARVAAAKAPPKRARGRRQPATPVAAGAVTTAKTAAAAAPAPLAEGAPPGAPGTPATGAPAVAAAPSPAAAKAAAKLGPAAARAGGPAEAAGLANGSPGKAAAGPDQDDRAGLRREIVGLLPLLRGRWTAWGIAAAAAAGLGVIAALTIGGPVSGSSQCATRLACLPTTTVAAGSGNAGEIVPAPTDASGNGLPTTTRGSGLLGPASGFPLRRSTSTTGRATTTTQRVTGTSSSPKTTRPTSPPTTAPPTTAPPTTAPPTTAPPTTPTTTPPAL